MTDAAAAALTLAAGLTPAADAQNLATGGNSHAISPGTQQRSRSLASGDGRAWTNVTKPPKCRIVPPATESERAT
jgi:hypothetical protein